MDKNLTWTSSLGEAYATQPQDVTDAVQTMRQEARKAGHLDSNEQEKVTTQGNTIVIEPANPEVVYVLRTILGSCTGRLSLPTLAGIRCPGSFGVASTFPLVLDLVSASSEDLGGAGATGGTIGMTVRAFFDHHAFVSHSRDFRSRGVPSR